MIDDKSSLIDKIGYYVENPEDENTLKNIFSQEERSLLDAVRELELIKAAAPEEKPVFRRSTRKFPSFSSCHFLFLFLHLDFSFIYSKFSMPFWGFFIEKIFLICYNNSTL